MDQPTVTDDPQWQRVAGRTLAGDVYQVVRTRILEGRYAPGEFLREGDLSQGMGVSKTPVREALGRLASEGFLERIPHRGFRLPEEPFQDLLELYPVVASLDLLAGRLALPRLGPEDIVALRDMNEALRAARDAKNVQQLIELNNRFHQRFAERSGNRRLCDLLGDLRTQLMRLERWYYSDRAHAEESIIEHEAIITAIERSDHVHALQLLETNMSLTYRRLQEELSASAERPNV